MHKIIKKISCVIVSILTAIMIYSIIEGICNIVDFSITTSVSLMLWCYIISLVLSILMLVLIMSVICLWIICFGKDGDNDDRSTTNRTETN